MTTIARPDLSAHAAAMRMPFPELVAELQGILGSRLVAYLGGVKETRAVRQWAEGTREPDSLTRQRLRESHVIASMLLQVDAPSVVQAWFQGLNPLLDDRSPAYLLREGDLAEVGPQILAAARLFIAHA